LLTDGSPKSQWAKIEALGIKDIFESVVVTGEWGSEFSKPHVRGYRHLEAEFGPHETRFLYVADNPAKDFFAPRDLGWSAIRVKRPAGLYQERPCPPGLVRCEVPDLSSLPEMLAT
jgi:putative hydrolase of the HAD superfamily